MKLPKWLFWWQQVDNIIWAPAWWIVLTLVILWIPFLRVWWWIFLPLMLMAQLKELYIWWISWDFDYAKTKWVVLELVPPKELLVPLKAMEDIFSVTWPLWDHPNFREKWCDGMLDNGPQWCSWEIASIEGKVHFYLRCTSGHKTSIETALYAHYPDLEIREVQDYTKLVPQTVPNEEWDMYGEDWILVNSNQCYPIKTYEKFFEPQGEKISAEEKRIDPIISLLESMSRLGQGEHYWVQFITVPVDATDEPEIYEQAKKAINKITKRPEKKQATFFEDFSATFTSLIMGPKKEGESYSWPAFERNEETGEKEMALTPGEREILTEIEGKMKKPLFRTTVRGVYVARRENWRSPHRILMRGYMAHFSTKNLNAFRFGTRSRPRIHYFMRKRRVFLRARQMFRNSVLRFPPLFPERRVEDDNPILNSEELATLWHFPLRTTGMVAPTLEKIESKKAGPPPNLPVE